MEMMTRSFGAFVGHAVDLDGMCDCSNYLVIIESTIFPLAVS